MLQHKVRELHRALHGVRIGLHKPVQRTIVSDYADSTSSVPPTRLKRKKEKGDAISMLREGKTSKDFACPCLALRLVHCDIRLQCFLSFEYLSFTRTALEAGRRSEIDVAYQEGAEYLQTLGIESKGEVARILDIAMNPNSLFLTLRDKKRAVNSYVRVLCARSKPSIMHSDRVPCCAGTAVHRRFLHLIYQVHKAFNQPP